MNFLQTGLTSALSVAENIITCLSCGVFLKMACTSARISIDSRHLSHSSTTKWRRCVRSSDFSSASALILPGVPTMICGHLLESFSISLCCFTGSPPKKLPTRTFFM